MMIMPRSGKGVNSADLGPMITSSSPACARMIWSYFSPMESEELMTDTRSPNLL